MNEWIGLYSTLIRTFKWIIVMYKSVFLLECDGQALTVKQWWSSKDLYRCNHGFVFHMISSFLIIFSRCRTLKTLISRWDERRKKGVGEKGQKGGLKPLNSFVWIAALRKSLGDSALISYDKIHVHSKNIIQII